MTRASRSPSTHASGPALHCPALPGARIALRGVRLTSRLTALSQRTTIEQTFINAEPTAIEAVYTFPLPEDAAVCGFEVVTADRVLTGQIEEAEQAVERYEQAIGQGHGAFLMEQDRPDVFTVRVGNLKPGQAVAIRLTYVCPLDAQDRSIRLAFPTTVAPRYISGAGADPLEAALDGDALNPPHMLRVPYGLTMEVQIDLGRQLKRISSPTHAIQVDERGDGSAIVRLSGGVAEMNRDIVLAIDLRAESEPIVEVEAGPGGESYLAVTFVPEFDVDELARASAPAETVFVLDCSGSMKGDSIRQATAALEICLRGLSEGDAFNVCRFGSTFQLLASEPLRYSQATLDRAIAFVRAGADLGGTALLAPLEAILRTPPAVGAARQIVLLTDGQVTNEPACIDLARRNRARNRIFSFGIGAACSAFLVKGLARATGGAAEFITTGERIDDKVLRTFSRLASPLASNVAIDWAGAEVQTLAEAPPIFDGDAASIFARALGKPPARVTLSCTTPSGPRQWTVAVPPPADHGGVIATMWARRTIQSLEEVNGIAPSRSRPAAPSRERQMLISLSKQFGLLSSLTAFIAVEHRSVAERNAGNPALRRVPVMLAAGWGGVELPSAPASGGSGTLMYRELDSSSLDTVLEEIAPPPVMSMPPAPRQAAPGGAANSVGGARRRGLGSMSPAPAAAIPADGDDLLVLLSAQQADGSFDAPPRLDPILGRLGIDPDRWRKSERQESAPPPIVRTALILALLETCFADRRPLWKRAADKAMRYLAQATGRDQPAIHVWVRELGAKLMAPNS